MIRTFGFRGGFKLDAALFAAGLLAVVWCVSDLFSGSSVPAYRDLLSFVYPYRAFLAEHLTRGEVPLWNPFVRLGVPFMASLHASVFYPPSLILLVPFPLGFNLFLLAHFAIAWAGAALWLRDREVCGGGAVVGALVFTIGGYMAAAVTNTAHLQAAVWAPWILLAWSRYCRGRSGSGFLATTVLLVVQLLAGAPEVWMSMVAVLGAWTLFAASAEPRRNAVLTARLAACVGLVFALSAFQVLPTFEYLGVSRRASHLSYGELTYWSMSPVALLQLVFPHSTALAGEAERGTVGALLAPNLPLVHSIYLGIAGLCLAIAGVVAGRERLFWMTVSVFGVLLALGQNSPFYDYVFALMPGFFGRIRYPEKFLFLFHLGASVLAAHGAAAVFREDRRATRISLTAAATLGVVALAVAVVGWLAPQRLIDLAGVLSGRGDWPTDAFVASGVDLAYKAERALWLLAGFGALVVLRARRRIGAGLFGILVVVLLAADLASVHRGIWLSVRVEDLERAPLLVDTKRLRAERQRLFHYQTSVEVRPVPGLVPWRQTIDERSDIRRVAIESWRTVFFDIGMLHGVGNLSGGDSIGDQPLLGRVLARLPRERAIDLLGRFGVAVLVGPDELASPNIEIISSGSGEPFVYRIRPVRPFASLASEIEVVADEETALRRLADPSFPREGRAIVRQIPEGWPRDPTRPASAVSDEEKVVLRTIGTNELALDVACNAPRLLVVSSADFPGWQAEIDGHSAEIIRTNGLVQGVVVPPGNHSVRLVYRPASFRVGIAISVLAATVAAAGVALRASRRKG